MSITIGQDYIDSRDIDERIGELENALDVLTSTKEELDNHEDYFVYSGIYSEDDDEYQQDYDQQREDDINRLRAEYERLEVELRDEREELEKWTNLKDEVSSPEWSHGIQFIHEDSFTKHIEELCAECGYIAKEGLPWWIEIDWENTADNCKSDYREVETDGETYLFRD